MPYLIRNREFFLVSVFQEGIHSVDLSHLPWFIERFRGYRLSVIGLDIGCHCSRRLYFLQPCLHDCLEMDVLRADSVDGPLFDDASPVLEGDLYE
jgi:hypothetical protein